MRTSLKKRLNAVRRHSIPKVATIRLIIDDKTVSEYEINVEGLNLPEEIEIT